MPRSRNTPQDPSFAQLTTALVAISFNVPELSIRARGRGGSRLIQARQVAMYLLNEVFCLTQTRIAEIFERDRSTVAHACHVIEDTRDDPLFDAKLERLEELLYPLSETIGRLRA